MLSNQILSANTFPTHKSVCLLAILSLPELLFIFCLCYFSPLRANHILILPGTACAFFPSSWNIRILGLFVQKTIMGSWSSQHCFSFRYTQTLFPVLHCNSAVKKGGGEPLSTLGVFFGHYTKKYYHHIFYISYTFSMTYVLIFWAQQAPHHHEPPLTIHSSFFLGVAYVRDRYSTPALQTKLFCKKKSQRAIGSERREKYASWCSFICT